MFKYTLLILTLLSSASHAATCDNHPSIPDAGRASGNSTIALAWYGNATTRYAHGVLGDKIEAQTLYVQPKSTEKHTTDCPLQITLDIDSVFEDVTPRIADVTGDGQDDIITIESHQASGASLAIYSILNGQLHKVTATPHIGQSNRWLAPVGTADFNNDDILDVAYVKTPHLAGVLMVWSFAGNQPELIAERSGFSNHRIGQNYITGGIRKCNGPEIILPDRNWNHTVEATITEGNAITMRVLADNTEQDTIARLLACE